jgi:hypothetical protein
MVCVMRSIENTNEETLNNGVWSGLPPHDKQTLSMLPRNRRVKKRVGRMRVKFILPWVVV